ncbi:MULTISPECIES: diaminobutyrate--2-oxoglutarate transaminase [unclassified Wenzhouxiangella]|uniref:diaminobutyrate--2-oxoglutarate transaminase n=1 Tax=unclassified Wenzhouxiangella TaxID=2613841 RepID=UPI000E32575C|nr:MULTISPECIES: diaminobutyrate--2-oxoglutarate transaminase [unclassified Wenzhouxiangella]RFF27171.1 diaminobutyrate--2-oxoglutarate transaminase [Wenzhouxiangella sp. 15181]RFP69142.1 diaminobutyrate--2-oxoglutarate transaminase [Wenzhouxiangella sp. 15190]
MSHHLDTINRLESEVRSYVRNFPTVFTHSRGARLTDEDGREFIDFFAGAGVLNYGHNNPEIKSALMDYLAEDHIVHSLDMASTARAQFLERFEEVILKPRELDYKVQFPGPTGTNAVEAALKLARKVTGRHNVISFTNGFHGMTLGSLAVTGNAMKRAGAGVPLANASQMPFDGYLEQGSDHSLELLEHILGDEGSGVDKPAAVILETVQAEGGVNVARMEWLKELAEIVKRHDVLLIVDDIQVGCGRTGPFFSFEPAGIKPDIVCLSKSLSGFGLPFAVTLFKPELDQWLPGEHNGTFRGHNLAFVTATKALDYWTNDDLTEEVKRKTGIIESRLGALVERIPVDATLRGRGFIQGIAFDDAELAGKASAECFEHGLVIETAGIDDQVLKLLPPLTISDEDLEKGLSIIEEAVTKVANGAAPDQKVA